VNLNRNLGMLLALAALQSAGFAAVSPAFAAPVSGASGFQLAAADGAVTQALSLLSQGRFAQAQQLLEQALAKDPDSLEATMAMGQVLDYVADFEGALKYFKRAADANPDSLEAAVWLGAALLAVDKYDQSIAVSEKALSVWEKKTTDKEFLSRLWVNLAGAQGLKSKREGFLAMIRLGMGVRGHFEKALTLDVNSRTQYAMGRYFVEAPGAVGGDPRKGLPLLEKAIKLEPHYHAIRANYVRGLIAAGEKAEAKVQWTRFQADFGDMPGIMRTVKDIESRL